MKALENYLDFDNFFGTVIYLTIFALAAIGILYSIWFMECNDYGQPLFGYGTGEHSIVVLSPDLIHSFVFHE